MSNNPMMVRRIKRPSSVKEGNTYKYYPAVLSSSKELKVEEIVLIHKTPYGAKGYEMCDVKRSYYYNNDDGKDSDKIITVMVKDLAFI